MLSRRPLLGATLGATLGTACLPGRAADAPNDAAEAALRRGGVVIAFRHALAPGTFDPPGFRLGDCSTQRNLNEDGRAQARRIGAWFAARGLVPARVRSSPWCRCVDTAQLAFGAAEPWAALGSPRGASETTNAESLEALRRAVAARREGIEVWVTHMFVLSALVGEGSASGEGLVLASVDGVVALRARLAIP
ncbi:MAG: histidine phosphatase family protein [Piscinibacter sp.]|uniref:histidine phosphatase family protein n=1 Tax=Piscinibacter TaxID=1114981 RepID=UPI000FDE4B80|nr:MULTISPECIES: histidine phosphatase family protein [Piscinibacter]MCW5665724.1 histidine phosphatase family protein [Piscinibacter sp.]